MKSTSLFNDLTYDAMTARELLRALLAEKSVTVPADKNCDDFRLHGKEADPRPLTVTLRPATGDGEDLIRDEKELTAAIRAFAGKGGASEKQKEICDRYLSGVDAAFDPDGETDVAFSAGGAAAELKKQAELLDAHRQTWDGEARRRLGDSPFAYALLMRARRLYELCKLEAPACVLTAEEKLLAQALVFHRRCALEEKA